MRHFTRKLASFLLLLSVTSCRNDSEEATSEETSSKDVAVPAVINYSVVKEYPHDPKAFTEGLEYVDGYLYESTGQNGESGIRRSELKTGKVLQQQKLSDEYFGEGITIMNGKIYQLTYQEKTGFVYDQKTMKLLQTFTFANNEGWGMTNDGTHIIYSDGTDVLTFLDPETLKEVKRVSVRNQYGPLTYINELEYAKGFIYANVWKADAIIKIDPKTGSVVGRVDLSNLRQQTGIPAATSDEDAPEALNGIAYDKMGNRFFITGKNWPKLFEVKLDN